MSDNEVINFYTCMLGKHPFVPTSAKHRVIVDGDAGWACQKCFREVQIASQLITEGPPTDMEGMEWPIIEG